MGRAEICGKNGPGRVLETPHASQVKFTELS